MHAHVELGPASCLAPALCRYGKRRGNQEMGGEKVTKPAQMNKSSRKNSSSETTEKKCLLNLILSLYYQLSRGHHTEKAFLHHVAI